MKGNKINYIHRLQGYEVNCWKSLKQEVKKIVEQIE